MVHVPRNEILSDPLVGLSDEERSGLTRSEHHLLHYLDRLVRLGKWPPAQPPGMDIDGSGKQ
jgi:hypothetical protein